MAAGRGEFFQSFLRGLERLPAAIHDGRTQQGHGRGRPDHRGPGAPVCPGRKKNKKRPKERWSRGENRLYYRFPETTPEKKEEYFPKSPVSKENLLERLPSEILTKIFSFLDVSSLLCVGHVSKMLHGLANDDGLWRQIYVSEFGRRTWRPESAEVVEEEKEEEEEEKEEKEKDDWKKKYLRYRSGPELNRWRRELRDLNPINGLRRQTERVLRTLNVSWELTLNDRLGRTSSLQPSRTFFFDSSVAVRWSVGRFPEYRHISSIQLHGVRRGRSLEARGWRSLILDLDVTTLPYRCIGKDKVMELRLLSPGFVVGIWRAQTRVAFVMVCLHFHKLVEKSLLGSPVCPFSEPSDPRAVDQSDPEFGLHGFTLHFTLHNTCSEIMSGHFRHLSCRAVRIQQGLLELKVIHRTNLSKHRSLSGSIRLPWKSEAVEGSVENCCIMTVTLLDEVQEPLWCVSSPVSVAPAWNAKPFDYGGDHFLMDYREPGGQVKMKLVWLREQRQFLVVSLSVYVAVNKVDQHLSPEA
ncbi:F-box only protein 15-like [Mugil cephalus]|uniref:F-box only protein 15-like n=1 Tax=Mugil cephalus TaxID=48193 RepID=UPI001FB6FD9C|nr:F-box only protein 15-like [Mugil cephalus]XP_047431149.1 F-box only protein 15-like [Mugil cephalus]XP_047431150.1 F-box only protein 15-like [Mugil cephalus]